MRWVKAMPIVDTDMATIHTAIYRNIEIGSRLNTDSFIVNVAGKRLTYKALIA
jgi:hypothetical protein